MTTSNGNGETRKTVRELTKDLAIVQADLKAMSAIHGRLDKAIEKLTDVSTSIKSMLAVHEEKISRQEQIDDIIFGKLKDRESEIDNVHKELSKEIQQVEKRLLIEIKSIKLDFGARVGILEKYKWLIMGGAIVIGWSLSTNFRFIIEMMS